MTRLNRNDWITLLAAISTMFIAGAIGSLTTTPNIDTWYQTLQLPPLAPPEWLFAPVWISLYIIIGISTWLVWRGCGDRRYRRFALGLFVVQAVLNALWSVIFFGMQEPGLAFVEIALLWGIIAAMIVTYREVSQLAAGLLAPYILWVSFAAYLNLGIWLLN